MALLDLSADRSAVAAAGELADRLLADALAATSRAERRRARRLGRLLDDPAGRELLFALTDEVLRAPEPTRAMGRLGSLVAAGLPGSLGRLDRLGLRLAALGSRAAPRPVAALVDRRIRHDARRVVLPAEDPAFARALAGRRAAGFDVNVNLLGEAILGDDEAASRLEAVRQRLGRPDVGCVSVKASALCANLDVVAFEASVGRVADRLREVFRVALEAQPRKLVNLDMEEYRDLELTAVAFRSVLDEPEFLALEAGLALQAYLPDSHVVLDELCRWAAARRARGGAPVRVRLVKGANLAMERVEAELGGWEQAPYATKAEADASFKRMLDRALESAAAGDLRLGVASHNLFDVAWALHRRHELGLGHDVVEVEALEGMAPAQTRAVAAAAGSLLLYTPVVAAADWAAATAYLARRLDENAAPDGFLRALFSVTPGSPRWAEERTRFEAAVAARHTVSTTSRRRQDRATETLRFDPEAAFANVADTDFTVAANRDWIRHHLAHQHPTPLPALVATAEGVDAVLARAGEGAAAWAATSWEERRRLLTRAAEVMAAGRGRTLAVMAAETAKTVREGDPEVSEAVDFARWAAASTRTLEALAAEGVRVEPLGTVLVAGPWNFPYAIPANGVLSALAAGNAVVLKPAPEAVATAAELVAQLHRAGLPTDTVQLLRCPDDDVGRHLVTHPRVDAVVLTGAFDTARRFGEWKPSLRLLAETSGKNALVVTGGADLDLAIRDLVRSAFGHAGQKCSAASLAVLDREVHDDPRFLPRLADAVRSLRVGPAADPATMMGPLIRPPEAPLRRALTHLDSGERWLVEPRPLDGAGFQWTPGLKAGVEPGSWFHRTECFGPVLGVIRVQDLDEAIAVQNATDFGLTGGLHSLDPDEIAHWRARVEVGNAYVNRHTTGAVVGRQPFGGWKRSSVGPGAKTGGPGDVLRFVRCTPGRRPLDVAAGAASYRTWWRTTFGVEQELVQLRSEANHLRYRPVRRVVARLGPAATHEEVALLEAAAAVTGVPVELSAPPGPAAAVAGGAGVAAVVEDDRALADRLAASAAADGLERLRALGPLADAVSEACHRADVIVDPTPLTADGRIELPRWLREQSVSRTLHRHGRIPAED